MRTCNGGSFGEGRSCGGGVGHREESNP
jgi:hypothetical protein